MQVIYKVKIQLDHTFFIVNCFLGMILEFSSVSSILVRMDEGRQPLLRKLPISSKPDKPLQNDHFVPNGGSWTRFSL